MLKRPQRQLVNWLVGFWIGISLALAPVSLRAQQTVSFDAILAAPNDLELNLAYARQEAGAGRLEQAAGALERLLLVVPEWDAARLFYAIVLYRLADLEGAERELRILQQRDLTPKQQGEVARYLSLVDAANKPWRIIGELTAGALVDTNPRRSAEAAGAGPAFVFTGSEDADIAATATSRWRLELDLKNGHGDLLFAEAIGWANIFADTDEATLYAGRLRAGAVFYRGDFKLSPYGTAYKSHLDYDRFFNEAGAGIEWGYAFNPQFRIDAAFEAVDQDYNNRTAGGVGSARDGQHYRGWAGFSWRTSEVNTFRLRAGYGQKDAASNIYDYNARGVDISDFYLLGDGQYLFAEASWWHTDYKLPDPRYSVITAHEEDRYRLGLAYGTPLGTLFRRFSVELPSSLGEFTLQVGGSYSWQESTYGALEYDSITGTVLLTKRFAF